MKCHCGCERFEEYTNLNGRFRRCLACGFATMIKPHSIHGVLARSIEARIDELKVSVLEDMPHF